MAVVETISAVSESDVLETKQPLQRPNRTKKTLRRVQTAAHARSARAASESGIKIGKEEVSVLDSDEFEFLPKKMGMLKKQNRSRRLDKRFFYFNNQFLIYAKAKSSIIFNDNKTGLNLGRKRTDIAVLDLRKVTSITTKSEASKLSRWIILEISQNGNESSILAANKIKIKHKVKPSNNTLLLKARDAKEANEWLTVLNQRWTYFLSKPVLNKFEDEDRYELAEMRTEVFKTESYQSESESNRSNSSESTSSDEESEPSFKDTGYVTGDESKEVVKAQKMKKKSEDTRRNRRSSQISEIRDVSKVFEELGIEAEDEKSAWKSNLKPDYNYSLRLFQDCFFSLSRDQYMEPGCAGYTVRSKDYLTTRKKMVPEDSEFELICSDLVQTEGRVDNMMEDHRLRSGVFRDTFSDKVIQVLEGNKRKFLKVELPFLFALHIQIPGPPFYSSVSYFAPKNENFKSDPLWSKFFFGNDDEFRDERFKLIPKIIDGPFVVKAATPTKPALLGKKLKMRSFRSDDYLELCIDVGSSVVAWKVVQLCSSYSRFLTVDLAIVVEGREEQELPEKVVGTIRFNQLKMTESPKLEKHSRRNSY